MYSRRYVFIAAAVAALFAVVVSANRPPQTTAKKEGIRLLAEKPTRTNRGAVQAEGNENPSVAAAASLPVSVSSSMEEIHAVSEESNEHPASSFAFEWEDSAADEVNPLVPGNQLLVQGSLVSITAYQVTPAGNALKVLVTPQKTDEPAAVENASAQAAQAISKSASKYEEEPAGFTYEEALFRAKWGWAAFAQAQREGAYHPADTP